LVGRASPFFFALLLVASHAQASPDGGASTADLDRARALFSEALTDQEAGRTAVALDKFMRVAETRDTAQVEYRIATCLEALGRRRQALLAFDRSARLGRGEAQADDVVVAANEHIASLAASMGKVAIRVRGASSPSVRVDGENIDADELATAITLEPGSHAVDVSAVAMKPVHATVVAQRAQRVELSLDLVTDATAVVTRSYTRRNVGIAWLGAGAALGIATGTTLLVRQGLIDSIENDCPNNVCPSQLHDSIEGMRSTATALMPLAIVLGVVAIVVGGVGITLIALGPSSITIGGTF
jgi:hypothetical protein